MEVIYPCCGGIDVHEEFVVVCLSRVQQGQRHKELRRFATYSADLRALCDWLAAEGCTHVAMGSTGIYWRPVYNRLVGQFEVMVVNAQHMKAVPGRKTDVQDAEWIADLLQHGSTSGQFRTASRATTVTGSDALAHQLGARTGAARQPGA